MAGERLAARLERLREVSCEMSLPRLAVEKVSPGGRLVHEARCARVKRSSLTMRSHGRRARRGSRRVLQDSLGVLRRLRVVRESRNIRRAGRRGGERGERLAVKRDSPIGWKRFLDGQARQLVPERNTTRLRSEEHTSELQSRQ